jgi:hypothetical protein
VNGAAHVPAIAVRAVSRCLRLERGGRDNGRVRSGNIS